MLFTEKMLVLATLYETSDYNVTLIKKKNNKIKIKKKEAKIKRLRWQTFFFSSSCLFIHTGIFDAFFKGSTVMLRIRVRHYTQETKD